MLGGSGDQQPEVVRRNPFTGLPRLSKGIAGTMVVLYLLTSMSATLKMALTLIPGYTLGMFFVWNVFTCGFVETSLFSLLLSCAAVLIFGKQFEPLWGSKEFAKFILVVNTLVGTSLFVLAIVVYIFTRIEMIIFTPLFGFTGVIGAFTVALKQLMPEQEMPFCIVMQMRAKYFPVLFVMVMVVFALLFGSFRGLLFVVSGVYYGWLYLRFFQHKDDGSIGDQTEDFAFHTFFPEPMQPAVDKVSSLLLSLFRKCGCFKGSMESGGSVEGGQAVGSNAGVTTFSLHNTVTTPLPGNDEAEADRKRKIALAALEKRQAEKALEKDGK